MEQLVSSPWFIAGEVVGSSPTLATNNAESITAIV